MEKKTVFLELPCDLIDSLDHMNNVGDRSVFISDLLKKQLDLEATPEDISIVPEVTTMKACNVEPLQNSGKITLVDSNGISLGTFNINDELSFENMIIKIGELSNNPKIQVKSKLML